MRLARLPFVAGALSLCLAGSLAAAQPPAATPLDVRTSWLRVYLTDGTVVSSFGEYTRVDDAVLVPVPVGPTGSAGPQTITVSLPASLVNWTRTDAYRDTVRRARYDSAGGAREYAAFTEDIAATLRDVALVPDPLLQIGMLETARARLAAWPAAHHGYRREEVAETLSVVDDLMNGLRAVVGQQAFSFALTSSSAPAMEASTTDAAGAPGLLEPPPTLQDVITQSAGLARVVESASERTALLRSASALLEGGEGLDRDWASRTLKDVQRRLDQDNRITRAYVRLRDWALERTTALLARADVRGLLRLRQEVGDRDARLERQRPDEVAALLGTVDVRLAAARQRRLELERWAQRRPVVQRYADAVLPHVHAAGGLVSALEDIKVLAGPGSAALRRAEGQVADGRAQAQGLLVPDEARAMHDTWVSGLQLAARALQLRQAAIRSGDLREAWDASAAAAGALLLLHEVRTGLVALTRPPAFAVAGGS